MFSKKNLKHFAIFDLIINVFIGIMIINESIYSLPIFIMGVLYICVGINDWRFRYPETMVGIAIDGWLMTFTAIIGFIWVNNTFPNLTIWSWIAALEAITCIPAMLHPSKDYLPFQKK